MHFSQPAFLCKRGIVKIFGVYVQICGDVVAETFEPEEFLTGPLPNTFLSLPVKLVDARSGNPYDSKPPLPVAWFSF